VDISEGLAVLILAERFGSTPSGSGQSMAAMGSFHTSVRSCWGL